MNGVKRVIPINVENVYLTFSSDPTTSIDIFWHTKGFLRNLPVKYRVKGTNTWIELTNRVKNDFLWSDRNIHYVQVSGLTPSTQYEFLVPSSDKVYQFKTMPAVIPDGGFFRVALTGDQYDAVSSGNKNIMKTNTERLSSFNPHFMVSNGDMAHADNSPNRTHWWYDLFEAWDKFQKDTNGNQIPVMVSIGNHEFVDGNATNKTYNEASQFFELFSFPSKPAFNYMDFGNYLTVICLDSEHYNKQEQAQWLDDLLSQKQGRQILIYYHRAAYGGHYSGDVNIANLWFPIFNKYDNVKFIVESHNHVFVRTVPIKDGAVNPNGIISIGQGGFASRARSTFNSDAWYAEKISNATKDRHSFWIADFYKTGSIHIRCIDHDGGTIDEFTLS